MDPKCIRAEDIGIVQTFYDHWEIAIKTHGIWPCNIYNMDETGFQIGQGKVEKVITAFPEASANIGSAMTCKLVTVVECISAEGKAINPFLVLAGSYHLEDWYKDCGLPDNWMITLTPNGYITDEGGYDWIHHFEIETHPSTSWEYWLLLLDNHGSHLTYDFLHFCEECQIIPYFLPPHMTHHLQPLDGIPFQQYKHWHAKAVNEAACLGEDNFHHQEFLQALPAIREKAFTPRVLHAGWTR